MSNFYVAVRLYNNQEEMEKIDEAVINTGDDEEGFSSWDIAENLDYSNVNTEDELINKLYEAGLTVKCARRLRKNDHGFVQAEMKVYQQK